MLTHDEGTAAVRLARDTIEAHLEDGGEKERPPGLPGVFDEKRGVFVTLRKHGELRGCIGHPFPHYALWAAIRDAAVGAATEDPRFPPVEPEEMSEVRVEVTILTTPERISAKPRERMQCFEIGQHGLIIKRGQQSGLLLPQVPVEHEMDEMEFLCQTCMKAGLMPDAWLEEETKLFCFEGQIFEETEPRGEIQEKEIC